MAIFCGCIFILLRHQEISHYSKGSDRAILRLEGRRATGTADPGLNFFPPVGFILVKKHSENVTNAHKLRRVSRKSVSGASCWTMTHRSWKRHTFRTMPIKEHLAVQVDCWLIISILLTFWVESLKFYCIEGYLFCLKQYSSCMMWIIPFQSV